MAQQKKEEEERLRKEEADKKAKEAEEKRKRLEEAEKKRQAMMQAQKEKQQAAGQGAKGPKKTDSGVSSAFPLCMLYSDGMANAAWLHKGGTVLASFNPNRSCKSNDSGDRGGNDFVTNNEAFPRQSPLHSKLKIGGKCEFSTYSYNVLSTAMKRVFFVIKCGTT